MSMDVHPRKLAGLSARAWHRQFVAQKKPKVTHKKRRRPSTRNKKRTAWMAKALRWRRVGTEEMFGLELLAVRTDRKPPTWRVTKVMDAGELAYYGLRKLKALPNGMRCTPSPRWELAGPEGYDGVHTYHITKMGALRLCADLDESKMTKDEPDAEGLL